MIKHNRKLIYLVGFFFSIPIALISYINSSFLSMYVDKNYVGLVYALASVLTILSLFKMPKILTYLGNRLIIILFSFFIFLSLIILSFENNIFIIIFSFILYFISVNFVITSLDIFIEDFSKNSSIGTLRGFYLMIINMAWIVAQLISGFAIKNNSFQKIYFLSSLFMAFVLFILILFLRNFKDPEYKKASIRKTLSFFVQNRNASKIYLSNIILQFFYAWMIIYTPIYLHEYLNFQWNEISIIFSIMLIPFLFDFPFGKLSDKIGEKKMLIIGFLIMVLSVLIIPLITKPTFWIVVLVLFFTRIGAAIVETMNESYFFKEVTEKNANEISFFRNAPSLSYVIAPLLAFPVLLFIPSFKYLFFFLSAVLLFGFLNILKLRDLK